MLNPLHPTCFHRLAVALALVAAAAGTTFAQPSRIAVASVDWNGALIPTFGTGGVTATAVDPNGYAWANAIAVDSQDRVIAVGRESTANGNMVVACYDRITGALDPAFGTGGVVTTSFGVYGVSEAHAVAIDPNGDIVVAGHAYSNRTRFALARYSPDGTLLRTAVTSFGPGTNDEAYAVAIDASGRVVAAGASAEFAHNGRFALARYDRDLNLDPTLNGDGNSDGLIVTNTFVNYNTNVRDLEQANAIVLRGGDIFVAGEQAMHFVGTLPTWSQFVILKYRSTGALDATFGSGGIAMPFYTQTYWSDRARANAIAIDGHAKVLVAGRSAVPNGQGSYNGPFFTLIRLHTNGSLDTSFGISGYVRTSFGNFSPLPPSEALTMALRGSSIVLAGWTGKHPNTWNVAIARYTSTGALDSTFDGDGRAVINLSCQGQDLAKGIAIRTGTGSWQPYPTIYIAGYSNGMPCN